MLFLTLDTFSTMGGIEKVCRTAGKVFEEISRERDAEFFLYSMHDAPDASTEPYIRKKHLKAFNGNKPRFVLQSVLKGITQKTVVLSHINLAVVGLWIKRLSPGTKVILLAHGIEVWRELNPTQKQFLEKADLVVAVSEFTRQRLASQYALKQSVTINNCIDPFLPAPVTERPIIRQKLGFAADDFIILTVSRLTAKEVNKNYDKVLVSMEKLKPQIPNLKYLFVGKYEEAEKQRLEKKAAQMGLMNDVVFAGYIPDSDLSSYYNASDLYVMPSKKEGFGITFIEAMYFGLPVIGGNSDGSTDALLNGRLGLLVDPERQDEITAAIAKIFVNQESFRPEKQLVLDNFGFDAYKQNWRHALSTLQARAGKKQMADV